MNVAAVHRFYNRFAGVYDLMFDQVFRQGRIQSIAMLGLRSGQTVLEVGVGTGLTMPLYPAGVKVVGIDLSSAMLREARDRALRENGGRPIALARMDATHLAFPDAAFDAVYAPYVVSVVHHPRRVVAEMARVCKPGGRVVVLNHFASDHRVGSWFERRLSPITHRVGFRLDLPVETILGLPQLQIEHDRRVNMMRLWRLLVFRRLAADALPEPLPRRTSARRPAPLAAAAYPRD